MKNVRYITLVHNEILPWPDDGEVIGIGRHCFYGVDDPSSDCYIPTIWSDEECVDNAVNICEAEYHYFIASLRKKLNVLNSKDYSQLYYEKVLGYWLIDFIHQAYDKYRSILRARALYPNAEFFFPEYSEYWVPADFSAYQKAVIKDCYALQVYSQILRALAFDYPHFELFSCLCDEVSDEPRLFILKRIKRKLPQSLFRLWNTLIVALHGRKKLVFVIAPYFKNSSQLWNILSLFISLRFRCLFSYGGRGSNGESKKIPAKYNRFELHNSQFDDNEFRRILNELIPQNIPLIFYENSYLLQNYSDKKFIDHACLVYTSNAHYSNSLFMHSVASSSAKLILGQHGGGYGTWKINIGEWWEKKISDAFLVWGWANDDPLKLINIAAFKYEPSLKYSSRPFFALYISATASRYCRHIMIPTVFEDLNSEIYLRSKVKLLSCWSENDKLMPLKVRLYPTDPYQWGEYARINKYFSHKVYLSNDNDYYDAINNASIVILDYNLTSLLELLSMNKPVIVCASDQLLSVRDEAIPYYDLLRKVGVIVSSHSLLVEFIYRIQYDIQGWWLSEDVQKARYSFVNRYAMTASSWPGHSLGKVLSKYIDG